MFGYKNLGYLDDIFLQGDSFQECYENLTVSARLLDNLGFIINKDKSVFVSSSEMEFLGFCLDSKNMIVKLNEKKSNKIKEMCRKFLRISPISIQSLSEIIGHLVAIGHGNIYAPLHYKRLEILMNKYLRISKGDYN